MSKKGYRRLVLAIFVTGIVLTLAHLCYIIYAYKQCMWNTTFTNIFQTIRI